MSHFETLIQHGWKDLPVANNREAIAQKADKCYAYLNPKNTVVSVMPCSERQSTLLKLQHGRGGQPNYFEVKTTRLEDLVDTINNLKDEADVNNYFGLYFNLQGKFETSILAWEQWETNYR